MIEGVLSGKESALRDVSIAMQQLAEEKQSILNDKEQINKRSEDSDRRCTELELKVFARLWDHSFCIYKLLKGRRVGRKPKSTGE